MQSELCSPGERKLKPYYQPRLLGKMCLCLHFFAKLWENFNSFYSISGADYRLIKTFFKQFPAQYYGMDLKMILP